MSPSAASNHGIARAHLEQKVAEEARRAERNCPSDDHAERREHETTREHQTDDIAGHRSQGHAETELPCAL
jgi:hypothetical protein